MSRPPSPSTGGSSGSAAQSGSAPSATGGAGSIGSVGGKGGAGGSGAVAAAGGGGIVAAGSGGLATAGAGGEGPAGCGKFSMSSEIKKGEADIVWVIDGSGSMFDELAAVTQNITNFANSIGAAGIDHHVVMLAEDDVAATTPLGADAAHYLWVKSKVGSHNALQVLIDQYPQYKAFLRPNAKLHFIAISDDESKLPATMFQASMMQLAGKSFYFHAIASEDVMGGPCAGACGIPILCGGSAPGLEYYALADATGGQKVSICIADWSTVFGPLQQAVIESAPLPCDYAIPAPPDGEMLELDKVNVDFTAQGASKATLPRAAAQDQCSTASAWHYDDPKTPKKIVMCPAACEAIKAGGTIEFQLGCATIPLEIN